MLGNALAQFFCFFKLQNSVKPCKFPINFCKLEQFCYKVHRKITKFQLNSIKFQFFTPSYILSLWKFFDIVKILSIFPLFSFIQIKVFKQSEDEKLANAHVKVFFCVYIFWKEKRYFSEENRIYFVYQIFENVFPFDVFLKEFVRTHTFLIVLVKYLDFPFFLFIRLL